jgi:hypothetical protein
VAVEEVLAGLSQRGVLTEEERGEVDGEQV